MINPCQPPPEWVWGRQLWGQVLRLAVYERRLKRSIHQVKKLIHENDRR